MNKPRKGKHKGLVITAVVLSVFLLLGAVGSCGNSEDRSATNSTSQELLERSTAAETSESSVHMGVAESAPEESSSSDFKDAKEMSSESELIQQESSSQTESSIENIAPLLAEGGEAQYLADCQKEAPFTMTMLDVKQGLSLLFESDGKYLLYDGGGRRSSSYVFSFVSKQTGGQLDYLVSSHYDEDHVSGLVGVLLKDKVGTVLCPDYANDTDIYSSFASALQGNGAAVVHPIAGDKYQLGNASVTALSADYAAEEENNRSIALKVTYGSFSIIVTGDAEEGAGQAMISDTLRKACWAA